MFTPAGKRWIVIVMVAITAWFGATMAFWATEPLYDFAPTGSAPNLLTANPDDVVQTSIRVTCASPWSSSSRSEPLPTLEPPLAYQDSPCAVSHRDGRIVLFIAIGLFVSSMVAGGFLLSRRSDIEPVMTPATA